MEVFMYKSQLLKHSLVVLTGMFLFFYLLNYLMPMAFGDDYLYAFKWQGNPMFVPLTDEAARITSWYDLFASQLSFYLTWSGRVINNTLAQLFTWAGKDFFNICNAMVCTLLIMEIYWCINRGKVTAAFNSGMLLWIFFVFWTFTPRFPSVVFWLVGAFHYLWPAFFLLGFLLPYIRKYYVSHEVIFHNNLYACFMFFFGVLVGCTNENSVCWIILVLLVFTCELRKKKKAEPWIYAGLAGLLAGYCLLMFAPGNYARLHAVHGQDWFSTERLLQNLHSFAQVLVWQFILLYFCLRSLHKLNRVVQNREGVVNLNVDKKELSKDVLLAKVFCIVGFGMSAVMLVSPEFHLRSAFPGTIQLLLATGILLRAQNVYGVSLLPGNVKKFLTCVGTIYFIITAGVSIHHLQEQHVYHAMILSRVQVMQLQPRQQQDVLCVNPFRKVQQWESFLSGFHTFDNKMSEDAADWRNVAFARYYGIKGISVLNLEDMKTEKGNE